MTTVTKNPLCDFRATHTPTIGVKATCTTTAVTPSNPAGNNKSPGLVVQDITACLVSGTAAGESGIQVNLIDGTTGGTNIAWSGRLSSVAGATAALSMSYLNIPCKSGFATLEFASASGTNAFETVSMGGYYQGDYWN